jgi:hypothetical protein
LEAQVSNNGSGPNFNRRNLNAAVPDLAQVAQQKAQRDAIEAARAADPWNGITIVAGEVPNSCLYEIYTAESLDSASRAANLLHAATANNAEHIAMLLGVEVPPQMKNSFAQNAGSLANLHIGVLMGMAQQKATLALAAATAAALDNIHPRWLDEDGTRNGGYAAVYLAKKQAQKQAHIEEIAAFVDARNEGKADVLDLPTPAE